MSWFNIIKYYVDDIKNWMGEALQEGYSVDRIYMDDTNFPLGRPWDSSTGRYRIFWKDNEQVWTKEQEEAGTPKSRDNPYYAPNTHPDEYADFKVILGQWSKHQATEGYTSDNNDLEFVGGNRDFWNKAYAKLGGE
mgnify:CR=1 FL=1